MKRTTVPDKSIDRNQSEKTDILRGLAILLVFGLIGFIISCGKTRVDLRTLVPAETLIYLETNDLAQTLRAITENENFRRNSSKTVDLSAINNLQVAIAVTGFGANEMRVTDQQSILNLKPKFVAIAEIHGWSWQIRSFVENDIQEFVRKVYDDNLRLERTKKNNTERYVWTAGDGRKAFAAIAGSQIFFGNDEEALNKSLLVKNGQAKSLLENKKLNKEYEKAGNRLVFGYVSGDGVKKISDILGVSVAIEQSEDENARTFISRTLPQILRNAVDGIVWNANLKEGVIEDRVLIKTRDEISSILKETITPTSKDAFKKMFDFLPLETTTVTRYNLKNPQVAFRSILLVAAKNVNLPDSGLIATFSDSILAPYGISDSEGFLGAIDANILSVRLDSEGEQSFVVAKIKDLKKIEKSISLKIGFQSSARKSIRC